MLWVLIRMALMSIHNICRNTENSPLSSSNTHHICFSMYFQSSKPSPLPAWLTESANRSGKKKLEVRKNLYIYVLPHDKTNKRPVHPVKTQISLGMHPV